MPGGQLQAALEAARAHGSNPAAAAWDGIVLTGTGFWGADRLALRELAAHCGIAFSGDLVCGHTTHLVLSPAAEASRKLQKAAEWGIPALRLAWLCDSAAAGRPLPQFRYLLDIFDEQQRTPPGQRQRTPPGRQQRQQQQREQAAAAGSCRQLPTVRLRPSSVASNAVAAVLGGALVAQQATAAGCTSGNQQQQQQQQQHGRRAALSPLHSNLLADQLRRMSISPEPPRQQVQQPSMQQRHTPAVEVFAVPAAVVAGGDSPPQQQSPSPQRSLSLQGMLGATAAESPAEVASGTQELMAAQQWQRQRSQSPETDDDAQQQQQPVGWSPMQHSLADLQQHSPAEAMQESPADASQQQQQQDAEEQAEEDECLFASGQSGTPPFAFSLAAALGRSLSEEPLGSPMAESPAATSAAAEPAAAQGGSRGSTSGLSSPSSMAGTPAGAGSQGEPICSLPTPACIRDWSDDDDSLSGTPASTAHGCGITQTPPAVRQALQVVANPTQFLGPRQLQQQQQQQVMPEEEEEQQLQSGAAAMQQVSPAAAAGLPDKEAVADEAPAAVDIVISDSETDDDLAPPPQLALQPQELQLPEPPSPLSQQEAQLLDTAALPQNLPFQQAHKHQQQQQPAPAAQLPPTAQRKGLLQISRSSAAGSLRKPPPVAPALPAAFPAEPIPVPEPSAFENEPMASPDGGRDPLQPSLSGSGDSSPAAGGAGNSVAAAAGAAEQQRPTSSSSAGPQVDEHFVTSRRPGASTDIRRQQQQQEQQAVSRRAVRDWSEDEVSGSSDDEFPTPKGPRRKAGGLTGLTQLDPSAIVIARPKTSASMWRVGGASTGAGGAQGAVGLKFLQRPPRGNAVREHHGLPNLKTVQFAEQVQVSTAGGLVLSTKDKKTAVRLCPGGLTEEEAEDEEFRANSGRRSSASSRGGSGGALAAPASAAEAATDVEPVLAEPQTFYRLADGSWWLEHCRYFTAEQAEAAATAAGVALVLPVGFDRTSELLKAVGREHAPLADVAGGVQVRRVKAGGNALRLRGGTATAGSRSWFWRLALDTASWRVLTDRAAADFVAIA